MKVTTNISKINQELSCFDCGYAYLYHLKAKCMGIILEEVQGKDIHLRMLTALSCTYISGPVSWENCSLVLDESRSEMHGAKMAVLADKRAGFELHCSKGFVLFEGNPQDFEAALQTYIDDL